MKAIRFILTSAFLLAPAAMMGCGGGSSSASSSNNAPADTTVPPPAGTPLALIKVGMGPKQVTDLIGQPTDQSTYDTGKRWIPYYYGSDLVRTAYLYKGQGRVIFCPDSRYTTSMSVIEIEYDPKEPGYKQ